MGALIKSRILASSNATDSGAAIGCAGCAMHKGPRRSEGPLAARRVLKNILFGFKGPSPKISTRAPTNLDTPLATDDKLVIISKSYNIASFYFKEEK